MMMKLVDRKVGMCHQLYLTEDVDFAHFQCRPEYKVPGLYVIDSIVRQSRHQYSTEKDVFAPRFTKNIAVTFQNLFKCPPDEKVGLYGQFDTCDRTLVTPQGSHGFVMRT